MPKPLNIVLTPSFLTAALRSLNKLNNICDADFRSVGIDCNLVLINSAGATKVASKVLAKEPQNNGFKGWLLIGE